MVEIFYSRKSGAYMKDRQTNLESHDIVIGAATPRVEPTPTDLSHLRPDKKTTGTQWN